MTQDVINAVKEAKEQSKPRNFTESVDIIINIRDLDVKKPENRFNEEVTLPNGRGKDVKIGVIADGELIVQAKEAGLDTVINKGDLEAFGKDRKSAKKMANSVDFLVAQADMMPLVGRFLGPVLGPRGKMPKPVPASIKLAPLLDRLQSTVKVGVKQQASIQKEYFNIKYNNSGKKLKEEYTRKKRFKEKVNNIIEFLFKRKQIDSLIDQKRDL